MCPSAWQTEAGGAAGPGEGSPQEAEVLLQLGRTQGRSNSVHCTSSVSQLITSLSSVEPDELGKDLLSKAAAPPLSWPWAWAPALNCRS